MSNEQTGSLEEFIRIHRAIGAKRSELSKVFDEQDAVLKEKQERIEAYFLDFLNRQSKSDKASFNTKEGLIYKEKIIIPTAANWDTIYKWIAKNDAWEFLEKRLTRTFLSKYMEAHDGAVPPGVTTFTKFKARVRKGTSK